MAESFPQNEATSENHCRERYFHPSNRPYRGRSRARAGRGRDFRAEYRVDNVERTLSELRVNDLREHLDRRHQYEQSRGGPPSDPAYNYLRDPLREIEDRLAKVHVSPLLRSNSYRGRGRLRYEEDTFIQNPMNIKVELSTSTGQRSYSLNEGSKLADIKHIPDFEQSQRGGFVRGRGSRGRGRGKYINDQPGEEQRIRSKSNERRRNFEVGSHSRSKSVEHKGKSRNSANDSESNSKFVSETVDYRGRGRGRPPASNDFEYMPENQKTRGRSFDGENRGRGRSRGRRWSNRRGWGNNQRQIKYDIDVQPANSNVTTEENWDDEDTTEKHNTYGTYDPKPEIEDAQNNDQQTDLPEPYSEDISIAVNASEEGNAKKRAVRFNLNENEEDKDEVLIQEKHKDHNF